MSSTHLSARPSRSQSLETWLLKPWRWRPRGSRSSRESWRRRMTTLYVSWDVYNKLDLIRRLYFEAIWLNVLQEEETEVDSHTMVKSGSEGAGTMRATSTMSDGAQTMIEHGSTMLESDLGTMVINSDDDDEEEEDHGSMRSEHTHMFIQLLGERGLKCNLIHTIKQFFSP